MHVLDVGCGSGEFTLRVAPSVEHTTGFDFAKEMKQIAESKRRDARLENVTFTRAKTRELAFKKASFDLIYSRRGSTSILLSPELLKPGGVMMGIHSGGLEKIEERLEASSLIDTHVETFTATEHFPTLEDLGAFWSRIPGHPDYLTKDNSDALGN